MSKETTLSIEEAAARKIEAVAVGASAGGVEALLKIFANLPSPYPLPIMVVLHIPEGRESQLAHIFGFRLDADVAEARDKENIQSGRIYFAPPGYHLSVESDRSFSLSVEEPINFSRPSIDVLMESAADVYGTGLVGVLLTGSNYDGASGLAHIKASGGISIAQSPAESQVPTMPLAAINKKATHLVLTLEEIRQLLSKWGAGV